eukprot:3773981-Rhodomonas_salina.1
MSGTEPGHAATRRDVTRLRPTFSSHSLKWWIRGVLSPATCCAFAVRFPVLRWHMLLPGDRPYIELHKSAPLSPHAPAMRFSVLRQRMVVPGS